jgi:transposase-like protein
MGAARLNLSRRRAIDPAKVKAIRAARRGGKSVRAVAAQFGVGVGTVGRLGG